jgi:hypothetical protein
MFTEQKHKHPENDIFFILLSEANKSGQEGISMNELSILINDSHISNETLENYLNKIIGIEIFTYDESTGRYKITKRGLYYLRFYAVTGIDIFDL